MTEFRVEDMTCSHCVGSITRAIKDADADALVEIDLQAKLVRVKGESDDQAIEAAIRNAGFTPIVNKSH